MTIDGVAGRMLLAALLAACPAPSLAAGADVFRFGYLQRDGDPFYEPHRGYTGLSLRDNHRPLDGARTALRDSRIVGRALGLEFELVERRLAAEEAVLPAVEALAAQQSVGVFLLDLPLDEMAVLAGKLADRDLLLFNIRHPDDGLRGEGCARGLFHTLPSHAMLMDGLAQFLSGKNWKKVLLLEGEAEADKTLSAAFQGSARKFGLKIVDVRPFVLSNDPRLRDRNNIALLTAGSSHDVVFLADTVGEFGRYVPYNTQSPRPIVGSEGLVADAWHWTWERHGAPQLNQRFDRIAKRRMRDRDFAAWAALRVVVEAIVRSKSTDIAVLRERLRSSEFTFDVYKGEAASFRSWDNQLRQAVLLHRHNAVVARAPIEGFLHEFNNLDTLGADARESRCAMP